MASTATVDILRSEIAAENIDFDPDSTAAQDVKFVDMRDFETILIGFFRLVGTGDLGEFRIIANSESDGSGTDVEIKVSALAAQPNLIGDQVWLEATAEEIGALGDDNGEDLRFVSASLSFDTSTDEGVVTYIRKGGRFAHKDLTADVVA